MKYRLALSVVLALGFAFSASPLWARVADISLKELVDDCDLIVVAFVLKVEDAPADLKLGEEVMFPVEIATARVLEVWKGNAPHEVRYVASPTWTCDVSDAKVGESVVLFLKNPDGWPVRVIAHSGRGRMPIRDVNGKMFAKIWVDDVRLPRWVMTVPDSETKYQFIRAVDLSLLRSTVKAMGQTDFLVAGSIGTFAVAGLTWLFSSRRGHGLERKPISLGQFSSAKIKIRCGFKKRDLCGWSADQFERECAIRASSERVGIGAVD